jgi:multidrug efflux pump subunit AcrB
MSLPEWSLRNSVLINLIMLMVLIGGGFTAMNMNRAMFPESRPNQISVATVYPGASPAEIEDGITIKIEERLKNLEEVDKIESTIDEGISSIMVTLRSDVEDIDPVVDEIKGEIDRLEDLPERAEESTVTKFSPMLPVIAVSLYGNVAEPILKEAGRRLRDDLLELDSVRRAVLSGVRNDEIIVKTHPAKLEAYGLSAPDVARAIRGANLDLSAGQLRAQNSNVGVRTLGQSKFSESIEQIVVRATPSGSSVRIGDLAEVEDGFQDIDLAGRFNGKPAVSITIFELSGEDNIKLARDVKEFVAGYQTRLQKSGTPLSIEVHSDLSRFIEGRLDLLRRNGIWGLMLVFAALVLLLNFFVAFWVAIGLAVSFMGTFLVMLAGNVTVNLISMFGLIVVLGLIVDDAIVIGENVFAKMQEGLPPRRAVIEGANEVILPVTAAVATTILAFAPLLFVKGQIGDFLGVLPIVVMAALAMSLLEALVILPAHLLHVPLPAHGSAESRFRIMRLYHRLGAFKSEMLRGGKFQAAFERIVRVCLAHRYITFSAAVAMLIVAVGLLASERVSRVLIQKMDSETLIATLEMPVGAAIESTRQATEQLEEAILGLPDNEFANMYTLVGGLRDFDGGNQTPMVRSHVAQLVLELQPVEERDRSSEEILDELRAKSAKIPGVNSLRFTSVQGGPGGRAIEVALSSPRFEGVSEAASALKTYLSTIESVYDIDDDADLGKPEIQIIPLESGRSTGVTVDSLATQVRAAYFGIEARTILRRREDVDIMVRYPDEYRNRIYDLESMRIAMPDGVFTPLSEIAEIREATSFTTIHRTDGKRTVTVTADVRESGPVGEDQIAVQVQDWLAGELGSKFPDIGFQFGGRREEFIKAFESLNLAAAAALLMIYTLLAGLFRSYIQPLIVISVVPFGVVGAILGHLVMGYPLTFLSGIGMVALTGILVNDSLILIDFINKLIEKGTPLREAVVIGAMRRARPIVLTSITTVLGLAPLMLETSFQARFLIPMAVSISFGLLFATGLTLILVPCLYLMVVSDVKAAARWMWSGEVAVDRVLAD